jgi:hypothetical protein
VAIRDRVTQSDSCAESVGGRVACRPSLPIQADAIQRFIPGVDFMSYTVMDAGHGENAWEHRFPVMLKFLFPPDR